MRTLIKAGKLSRAIPYIESGIVRGGDAQLAEVVSQACVDLLSHEFDRYTVEGILSGVGQSAATPTAISYCEMSLSLAEITDPTIAADASYWFGVERLSRSQVNYGVELLASSAFSGQQAASQIAAYLCDVINLDDLNSTIDNVPIFAEPGADIFTAAAHACEAAMSNPPVDRSQGEFVSKYAQILLGFDMSAEAAELLTSVAQSLEDPYRQESLSTVVGLCDAVAAHGQDPVVGALGVTDDEVIAMHAIDFCFAAMQLQPETMRFKFQYARGALIAGDNEQATAYFTEAMNGGYSLAGEYLGVQPFDASRFPLPAIMQAFYDGDDEALKLEESKYITIAQDALGGSSRATPFMFKFLSSLLTSFKASQAYLCGPRTYLRGNEIANLTRRMQRDALNMTGAVMQDPWAAIGGVLEQGLGGVNLTGPNAAADLMTVSYTHLTLPTKA